MHTNEQLAQEFARHDDHDVDTDTDGAAPETKAAGRRVAAPHVRSNPLKALVAQMDRQNAQLDRVVRAVSPAEARRRLHEQKSRGLQAVRDVATRVHVEARKGRSDPLLHQQVSRINGHLDRLDAKERADLRSQNAALAAQNRQLQTKLARPPIQPGALRAGSYSSRSTAFAAYRKASLQYLRTGQENFGGISLRELERKAGMHTGSNPDGGFLVHPEYDTGPLEALLRDAVVMRQVATVRPITGASLKKPVSLGGTTAGWVGEREAPTSTETPRIAELEFSAMELYAEPLASQGMLEDSMIDIETWLAEEVNLTFAEQEEVAYTSGNGVKKPRGFLDYDKVANAAWSWGNIGYFATGAAGAFPTAAVATNQGDPLWAMIYGLKNAHRTNAKFMMNSGTVGVCRTLKDGEGRWIWADPVENQPSKLCGFETVVNEQMPAIAANSYSIAFGDFARAYVIVDRVGVSVLRDPYTNKPWVKFYTRKRTGGGMQNFEALKLLKFAAS